jgi:hypothetical protein
MLRRRESLIATFRKEGGEYVLLPRKEDGRVNLRGVVKEVRSGDRVIMDLDGVVVPSCEEMLEGVWKERDRFFKDPVGVTKEMGRASLDVLKRVIQIGRIAETFIWTSRLPMKRAPYFMGHICCFPMIDGKATEMLERVVLRVNVGKPAIKEGSLESFFRDGFEGRKVAIGSSIGDLRRAVDLPVDLYFDTGNLFF